jgi:hypothetical protein
LAAPTAADQHAYRSRPGNAARGAVLLTDMPKNALPAPSAGLYIYTGLVLTEMLN